LFLAGYNRLAICKILLEHGADVICKDKGGLVSNRMGVLKINIDRYV
jgi:hypothetical protein